MANGNEVYNHGLVEAKNEYSKLVASIEDIYKKCSVSQDEDELFYEGLYKAKQFEEVLKYVIKKYRLNEFET